MHRITDWRSFMALLRQGPYTTVGSYPTFFVFGDAVLSHAGARGDALSLARAIRSGEAEAFCDVNWEDPELFCDATGERIPSAYAEAEAEAEDQNAWGFYGTYTTDAAGGL